MTRPYHFKNRKRKKKKAPEKKPNGHESYKKVFRDKEKLKEMLSLAKKGWSFSALARKYGTDHSSIFYHCNKIGFDKEVRGKIRMAKKLLAGVFTNNPGAPGTSYIGQKLMRDVQDLMLRKKMSIEQIAADYNVPPDAIFNYLKRVGVDIENLYNEAEILIGNKYFSEDGALLWDSDIIEGRVCKGKSQLAREQEIEKRKQRDIISRRKDLLSY